jgi:hypothetical protein
VTCAGEVETKPRRDGNRLEVDDLGKSPPGARARDIKLLPSRPLSFLPTDISGEALSPNMP